MADNELNVKKIVNKDPLESTMFGTVSNAYEWMPKKLSEHQLVWEMRQRNLRKTSIFVRGFRPGIWNVKAQINHALLLLTGVQINIVDSLDIAGGTVIKLNSLPEKIFLMKNKYKLKGTRIKVEDDYTCREIEVMNWIKFQVYEARRNGKIASYGYMKWTIEDEKFVWIEDTGINKIIYY